MVSMRLMRKDDIATAVDMVMQNYHDPIYAENARKELLEMFTESVIRPTYVVAEEGGKVIGFAGFTESWMDYHICEIFWVNVAPGRQRTGVGKRLIEKILELIKQRGTRTDLVQLTARPEVKGYYAHNFGFKDMTKFGPKNYTLMGSDLS